MSSDGTRVAIGAPNNDGTDTRPRSGVQMEQWNFSVDPVGHDIDGEAAGDQSGYLSIMSSDGTRVAIGAPWNDGTADAGHVRVYEWDNVSWNKVGLDIDGEITYDSSGQSVSMSSDGTRVAIGGRYNNSAAGSDAGHVRVYDWNSATPAWEQVGQDIDGEAAGDESGWSVSMSSDGTRVAIGAPYNDDNGSKPATCVCMIGTVELLSGLRLGSDIDGEAADDQSGYLVSISGDGTRVAIGAYSNDGTGSYSGHTRVYSLGAFLGTSGGSEDRLLNISSSDQAFTTLLPGKRSDKINKKCKICM